jgi:UDP-N-acetyl-D-galactosamine dehydrogenase
MKTLAVIGLGYVGLPLAAEFGKKRKVIGFDINQTRINELKNGHDRTRELDNEQLASAQQLEFSSDAQDLEKAQIFIVTVPTPVTENKAPDLTPIQKAGVSTTAWEKLWPPD